MPIILNIFIFSLLLLIILGIFLKIYLVLRCGKCKSRKKLDGMTAIVTGGNSGIGFETAVDLASRNARVIIASENYKDCLRAVVDITRKTSNQNVFAKFLDLSDLSSVRKFAKDILEKEDRLDILINNAGTSCFGNVFSKDNLILLLQINYFGPFLLCHLLIDLLKKTPNSRIVNVASTASQLGQIFVYLKMFDLDHINMLKKKQIFSELGLYSFSKFLVVYSTWEMAERLKNFGISVNCVHPGIVRTPILLKSQGTDTKLLAYVLVFLSWIFMKTPKEGAQTTLHCALSDECQKVTGKYFQDCRPYRPRISKNLADIRKVWDQSVNLVKLKSSERKM